MRLNHEKNQNDVSAVGNFSLYNADKQEAEGKGWTPQGEYYDRLTNNFGKASDCIACGQCERVCPQHLPIINNLKKVAAYFGK